MKITQIVGFSEQTYGKSGNHRATFKTQEYGDNIISAFVKFPLKEGQEIDGEVKVVEKDGKTYHNFEFAKKGESQPTNTVSNERLYNLVNLEVVERLKGMETRLQARLDAVYGALKAANIVVEPAEEFQMPDFGENNPHVTKADQPF